MTTTAAGRDDAPFLEPHDDLRHRPSSGQKMRDSLFWEMIMPDEQLGLQVYLYLTDRGRTGYNVSVWGPDRDPIALRLEGAPSSPGRTSTTSPSAACTSSSRSRCAPPA